MKISNFIFLILAIAVSSFAQDKKNQQPEIYGDIPDYKEYYLSPDFVKTAKDKIFVSCRTGKALLIVEGKKIRKINLPNFPSGLDITKDAKTAFVSLYQPNGKLLKIDVPSGKIIAETLVGHMPRALSLSNDEKFVYVPLQFKNKVLKIDTKSMKILATANAVRDPFAVAITTDGKWLVVANQLPEAKGGLYEENIAAAVNLIDATSMKNVATINLPNGAINAQDVVISKNNKYAYITHIVTRFNVPTTQVERGWINTNAISIVDINKKTLLATVLIDDIELGAANPYGIIFAGKNSEKLVIAQSGTHEICVINYNKMHKKISEAYKKEKNKTKVFEDICNDLSFLSGMKDRIALHGYGPRHLCAMKNKVVVGMYYSDVLNVVDLSSFNVKRMSIGGNEKLNEIRRGDLFYHDASLCFQKWLSCITCHTEVRSDALNWDLLNDGIGNPKQSKSMLFAHFTPPSMITGVREHAKAAVRKGIRYIQFTRRPEKDAVAIDKYLSGLKPIPSPYLEDGMLSVNAMSGEVIFQDAKCATCHSGEYFTDTKKHDVGSGLDEYKGFKFDTPTLREVWRTAPYLYDGRAKTIFDMLKIHNKENKHGLTKKLTDEDLK